MRVVLFGLSFAAVACAPVEIVPRAAATATVCRFDLEPLDASSFFAPAVYPSEACVDQVLADFSVDVEALVDADGLADPYGVVSGEDLHQTALGSLLSGARAFFSIDLGTIDDAALDPAMHAELTEVQAITGGRAVGPLLYDWATARVRHTSTGDVGDADAGLNPVTGSLTWALRGGTGLDAAALLVHEARHRDPFDHVRCADGTVTCDDGPGGAWSFQMAVHAQGQAASDDPVVVEALQARLDLMRALIVR